MKQFYSTYTKLISVILLYFLISSCETHTKPTAREEQQNKEQYNDSIDKLRKRAHIKAENEKMDTLVKIIRTNVKTTENFEKYFELIVKNFGKETISDIQIASVPFSTITYGDNNPSYNVNLLPGKTMTIKQPFSKYSNEELNRGQYPIITKVRFSNGEFVERDKNIELYFELQ